MAHDCGSPPQVNRRALHQVIAKPGVRLVGAVTAALLLGATSAAIAAPSPRGTTGPAVNASQQLAALNHDTAAFSRPDRRSRRVTEVRSTRPITGERTVLPVVGHATGRHGGVWLEVLLPGRPNSHTGWISRRSATLALTKWQIIVRLSTREVRVFWGGRLAALFVAVVGKPSTPTPPGLFFVEESVALSQLAAGAPYALALSARSNALREFDGGPRTNRASRHRQYWRRPRQRRLSRVHTPRHPGHHLARNAHRARHARHDHAVARCAAWLCSEAGLDIQARRRTFGRGSPKCSRAPRGPGPICEGPSCGSP